MQPSPSKNAQLLAISNGHGEDQVAVHILQALLQVTPRLDIVALPMVGLGLSYSSQNIPCLVQGTLFPSGGFGGREFGRDLQDGFLGFTLQQIRAVGQWSHDGGAVLAVGDIVPLMLAWWSGLPYAFVGTAKSEYYRASHLSYIRSSIYWPWERWLMAHDRCRGVFPRDRITATTLQRWPIPVFDCGNPMMDDLEPQGELPELPPSCKILLLPGSRAPEVFGNWQIMISAIAGLHPTQEAYVFLAAIAPGIELLPLQKTLVQYGWTAQEDTAFPYYQWQQHSLLLIPNGFRDGLSAAHIVLAMAGTATEQAVGLGKPVITIPGQGPQFTPPFANAQAQLLGSSIYPIKKPGELPYILSVIQKQCRQPQDWIENGRHRMGFPGASVKIAKTLQQHLFNP